MIVSWLALTFMLLMASRCYIPRTINGTRFFTFEDMRFRFLFGVCLFVCLLCCFVCCVTTCKNIALSYFLTSDASFYRMNWIAILMINYKLI